MDRAEQSRAERDRDAALQLAHGEEDDAATPPKSASETACGPSGPSRRARGRGANEVIISGRYQLDPEPAPAHTPLDQSAGQPRRVLQQRIADDLPVIVVHEVAGQRGREGPDGDERHERRERRVAQDRPRLHATLHLLRRAQGSHDPGPRPRRC